MAIQESDSRTGSAQPFPANENSIYPPRGTAKTIVGFSVGIALLVGLFAFASHHAGTKADQPLPPSQSQPSPAGSHDQQ